jgi:DNA-binding transcriptional ArsR family regulator
VKALAHPTRVRILGVLRRRELVSPVELSGELGVALGTVGYHVRRLEELGFLELATRTQRRGAVEHHYRARAALDELVVAPIAASNGTGGATSGVVAEAQEALARGGFDAVAALVARRSLTLDERGRARLRTALDHWTAMLERIEQTSARRLAAAGDAAVTHSCTAALLLFGAPDDAPAAN